LANKNTRQTDNNWS